MNFGVSRRIRSSRIAITSMVAILAMVSYSVPANAIPIYNAVATDSGGTVSQPGPAATGLVALPGDFSGGSLGGLYSGPVSGSLEAQVVITLQVTDPGALLLFDQEVSTLGSPIYGHYLTEAQFTQTFAPPASSQTAVVQWLSSSGFAVNYVSSDHLTVAASGTVSDLSKAFSVQFGTFETNLGTVFWAPVSTPSVPSSIPPLVGVAGLNNLPSGIHTDIVQTSGPVTAAAPVEGFGVQDFPSMDGTIFQLDKLHNSTGNASHGISPTWAVGAKVAQTLWAADTEDCGYSTTDMNQFYNLSDGYYGGYPKPVIQPHYSVPGYTTTAPGTGECGDGELTLDMEFSGSDAPGAYLDPTWVDTATDAALEADLSWLLTNVPNLDVITQSWGGNDVNMTSGSFEATYEQDFATAASEGISVFASSADCDGVLTNADGDCEGSCSAPKDPGIEFPGSSPLVLSVGGTANALVGNGTTVYQDNSGTTVWNWCDNFNDLGGSEGGLSEAFPKPSYMIGAAVNTSMGHALSTYKSDGGHPWSTTSARPDPDWSGPAAHMVEWINQAWLYGYGGTSFSSPATAGMVASIDVYDGHKLGQIGPALYSLEYQYLYKKPNNLLPPTYFVENYSNVYFDGATYYNESAGYGVPMAYNLSLDLGKPFVATNPEGPATGGTNYPITAAVKDIQAVSYVNVSYLAPGGTWQNTSLSLGSGAKNTTNYGNWTGSIPGSSLTEAGTLEYCVYATDKNQGNSWSPYNKSAWAVTGNLSKTFGCATPFTVSVVVPSIAISSVASNRTVTGETSYSLCFNTTFSASVGGPFYLNWSWGDGTKTSTSVSASPAEACHVYSTAGTYPMYVFVNSSGNSHSAKSSTTSVAIYQHVLAAFSVSSMHPVAPANETFANDSTGGHGLFTLTWNFNDANASGASAPPYQIYYKPGTYTISLKVVDALGYSSTSSYTLTVYGTSSEAIALDTGWNLIALPFIDNDYSLYELSVLIGAPLVSMERVSGVALANYSKSGANAANGSDALSPGNALWVDVSSAVTVTAWGNSTATLGGVTFASGWTGVGWSVSGSETASQVAALIEGTQAVSIWSASTQSWETYIVNFSDASFNFNIAAGTAVYVVTNYGGSFSE